MKLRSIFEKLRSEISKNIPQPQSWNLKKLVKVLEKKAWFRAKESDFCGFGRPVSEACLKIREQASHLWFWRIKIDSFPTQTVSSRNFGALNESVLLFSGLTHERSSPAARKRLAYETLSTEYSSCRGQFCSSAIVDCQRTSRAWSLRTSRSAGDIY